MSDFILHDHYTDPEAGRISSYFCRLFILIGRESIQYCILDTERNTFIALADYHLHVAPKSPDHIYSQAGRLFSEEEMLKKKYPSVVIGIDSRMHTLVPGPLFDPSRIKEYLQFNFRLTDDRVRSDRVEEIDAYNVYGLPGQADTIREHLDKAALVHRSTALVKAMYQHDKADVRPAVIFLHAGEQSIDLACFERNRPVFFNSFPCQGKEDILYFTLFAIEQLKMNPGNVQLSLSGNIDPGSDSYRLLGQYIREISFTDRLTSFNYSPALNQAEPHRYQDLFALALCGS